MEKSARLIECIADLQLGNISGSDWLQEMATVAECEAISVISWTNGKPESAIFYDSIEHMDIGPSWLTWVDKVISKMSPEQPALLKEIAQDAGLAYNSNDDPLADPNLLIAFLDSDPAITLFIFRTNNKANGWNKKSSKRLTRILPGLQKGDQVHKKLSLLSNRLELANTALNASPRAVVAMTPDGDIIKSNDAAVELLQHSSFSVTNGKLTINNPRVMQQFRDRLAEIRIMSPATLNRFIWNRSFRSTSEQHYYQLMLRGFSLNSWNLHSSSHDRVVTLTISCPDLTVSPTTDQLSEFYDLSGAQARVVLALLEGNDIMTSAAKLHISISTIRSHVRGIYAKLGVDNQRDLLRLLSRTLVDYNSSL
jgi:DNA-binding CsgD family transcriptional regulator